MLRSWCKAVFGHRLSCYKVSLAVIFIVLITTVSKLLPHWMSSIRYAVSRENNSADTDLTTAPPEGPEVEKRGRYVSMCSANFDTRRTGNQMFNLAAMLQAARLTGRRVATARDFPGGVWLDRWFEVPITRVDNVEAELCPCVKVNESAALTYDQQMSSLSNRSDIAGKNLLLCGYFQGWKYTVGIESALRHHLRLLPNVSAAVYAYLDRIRPSTWNEESFSRIGIHVRAGDAMEGWTFGYTIPQWPYFEQAMLRFVKQQRGRGQQPGRVQFIVTSDNLDWVKTVIDFTFIVDKLNRSTSASTRQEVVVDVVHSEGHDSGFDLALLSVCDGVIMSTGTYGWWGAWLANKTTVYYRNWPRAGSPLLKLFKQDDFFPPNWIPIGGPAFHMSADTHRHAEISSGAMITFHETCQKSVIQYFKFSLFLLFWQFYNHIVLL